MLAQEHPGQDAAAQEEISDPRSQGDPGDWIGFFHQLFGDPGRTFNFLSVLVPCLIAGIASLAIVAIAWTDSTASLTVTSVAGVMVTCTSIVWKVLLRRLGTLGQWARQLGKSATSADSASAPLSPEQLVPHPRPAPGSAESVAPQPQRSDQRRGRGRGRRADQRPSPRGGDKNGNVTGLRPDNETRPTPRRTVA